MYLSGIFGADCIVGKLPSEKEKEGDFLFCQKKYLIIKNVEFRRIYGRKKMLFKCQDHIISYIRWLKKIFTYKISTKGIDIL